MNQVSLIGNVTRDLELRESEDHHKYVQFTLAVHDYWAGTERTSFISNVAFGKQAELLAEYVKKGNKLAVNGHLTTEGYKDKEGKTVRRTRVIVEDFEFISSPKVENVAVAKA